MPAKPANPKSEPKEKEEDILDQELPVGEVDDVPEEDALEVEDTNAEAPVQRPEMKINFDYSAKSGQKPIGESQENSEAVQNQVSTLDDLLEKSEKGKPAAGSEEIMPPVVSEEVEEPEVTEDDEPLMPPEEDDETGIPQIKNTSGTTSEVPGISSANKDRPLNRPLGQNRPLNYQNSQFPHDNFGQSPLYANRDASPKPKKSRKLYFILLLLIGLLVIGGAVLVLKHKIQLPFLAAKPTPTPEETVVEASPSPSPTPEAIDRTKYKIRILNGTAKAGFAASTAAQLKELGYQTEKTGNATNSAFARTTIQVKKDTDGLLDQLVTDLSKDFDATGTPTLKSSDTVDGEVILGAK
jgi:hypothetical protein